MQNESFPACVTADEGIAKRFAREIHLIMTCHDCRGLLTDYQHGELDAATDAALHDHLQTCPSCRAELDAESALTDMPGSDRRSKAERRRPSRLSAMPYPAARSGVSVSV